MPRDNSKQSDETLILPIPNQTLKEPERIIQTYTFLL